MNLSGLAKSKIMIVDDNVSNLKVLLKSLEEYGSTIFVAMDGEEAIKRLESLAPDIILLDVIMPGIDGFETCRRMKENEATKDIPIFFMTALTETVNEAKGFELGAVDYITKPIKLGKALVRINTQLAIQRQQKIISNQNHELAELNTTKNIFFSIIAHDLKSPFMTILGYADLLQNSIKKGDMEKIRFMVTEQSGALKNLYKLVENGFQFTLRNPYSFIGY